MTLFCKVEDLNGKQYILTDKNKQPLLALPAKNTCLIANGKKFLNNPELLLSTLKEILRKIEMEKEDEKKKNPKFFLESDLYVDTKIPYTIKDENSEEKAIAIVNKSDIDFNIYDIATINKDIVITNIYIGDLTEKKIEQNYLYLFDIDKDNIDYNDKMRPYTHPNIRNGEWPPLDKVSEIMTKKYDYYQKLLTKEEYNNCIISDWTPCKDNTQTRKRTESTKIGKACTPDENKLLLTQTCSPPSSPSTTTTESSDNNMYMYIGIFIFFLIAIAFGVYMFKQKNQNPYQNPYPNQQYMYR
jgi:hypothetical protein